MEKMKNCKNLTIYVTYVMKNPNPNPDSSGKITVTVTGIIKTTVRALVFLLSDIDTQRVFQE
jgi:hypothetical protein